MPKKSNSKSVYEKFDAATRGTSAYAVIRNGQMVAKIIIKNASACRAFVHFLGSRMAEGIAKGGGYDRASAAIEEATAKHLQEFADVEQYDDAEKDFWQSLKNTGGYGWMHHLNEKGFNVHQVV